MRRTPSTTNWDAWRLTCQALSLLVVLVVSDRALGVGNVQGAATDKFPGKLLFQDGKLTAQITGTPLRQVIEEIGRLSGARVRWLGPVAEEPVTVAFTNTSLSRALRLILGERNFLLLYASAEADAQLNQIWISPAQHGTGQLTQASLVRVSAGTLWKLQRTALRGQNLSARFQAVEQLKRYAQTDARAKAALSRVARAAEDLFIRQTAARALTQIR